MNLLGIDFEDWFHPELIQKILKKSEKKDPKIVYGIDTILDWLRKNDTLATFFVVGELLEFKPDLLDKIIGNGHEIAFHTMQHSRLDTSSRDSFNAEIKKFSELTSKKSRGFRAPTFSLDYTTSWAIDVLEENNYVYDSSIVPAKTTMYGMPDAEQKPYKISSSMMSKNDPNGKLIEFPLLVTSIFGKKIPAAGGFYLRTLPMKMIKHTIEKFEKLHIPSTFYIHSWELVPELMPKIPLSIMNGFITYHNLAKTPMRMDQLVKKFKFTSFEKFLSDSKLYN